MLLTRSDIKAPRHENLAMFICPADLPGVTIQPLNLFASGGYGEGGNGPNDKHSVFFDDVRIPEFYLMGGDHDGWRAANATLEVEHGGASAEGGARTARHSSIIEEFINQCRSNPNIVKRLRENPQLLGSMVNIYIGEQIQRLWSLRNAWLANTGGRAPYTGPQLRLYSKTFGMRFVSDMARVLGPYAHTEDTEWGLGENIFEAGQRGALIVAPAGTPDALKIIISRALRIGR